MKLMIYADPHWSVTSSIVRSRGEKYSTRLEYLIKSIQWVEDIAYHRGCDAVVCLGDFFDTSQLNSEEITALGEIGWSTCPHYFITGNHEMGRNDLEFSSSRMFELMPNSSVIKEVCAIPTSQRDTKIVCLPYILEKDRKPLKSYLSNVKGIDECENVIILSHNDIKDIQMGMFKSTTGFTLEEIKDNCNLFINGHLHNGCEVAPGVINLGNLAGQNFSEDATKYSHCAMILDTAEHSVQYVENPVALNFYKITYGGNPEIFAQIKSNAVVTVTTPEEYEHTVREIIRHSTNIVESRVIVNRTVSEQKQTIQIGSDHIKKFCEYIRETLGEDELIKEELIEIGAVS